MLFRSEGQYSTPQRALVFAAKLYSEALGKSIPCSIIEQVSKVPPRSQSHIISTNHVRTLHNILDSGPDPRGGQNIAFTKQQTSSIADYLDHPSTSIDDKGMPWQDIILDSGYNLL